MRTTMMMLAAALLTAACGSTSAPQAEEDAGPGSGSGSGTMDTSCTTGADCDPGLACATDTHQCVAAAFTLDKAGFYDDGTRWWTATDAPILHGTIDDTSGQPLEVAVAGTAIGTAMIEGTTWSIALPAGSIRTTDTAVALRLGALEETQAFALDDAVPTVTLFGSVKDERGDAIDFSTGEPVHTHNGAAVDLTGTGCPAVYKYAYLMDETKPLYGREVSPNPFAWQIKVSDATPIDSMDSAYRVRDESGRVLYDWTSISPDATGVFSVALYRNVIPELGTYAGKLYMDVRFRDAFGNESVRGTCWDNHPMAAPLDLEAPVAGSLFGMTLAADDPISSITQHLSARVFTQQMIQYSSEPVTISMATTRPSISYSATFVDDYVASAVRTVNIACPSGPNDVNCNDTAPADPADSMASGTIAAPSYQIALIDDVSQLSPCSMGTGGQLVCTIPGRAQGEQPHPWHFEIESGNFGELVPPKPQTYVLVGEYTIGGLTYTGIPGFNPVTTCSHVQSRLIHGVLAYACVEQTDWVDMRALDHARLSFPVIDETFKTATTASSTMTAPASIPSANLTFPATIWDSGNDDLPGPH